VGSSNLFPHKIPGSLNELLSYIWQPFFRRNLSETDTKNAVFNPMYYLIINV
jgi:hypothetical protein